MIYLWFTFGIFGAYFAICTIHKINKSFCSIPEIIMLLSCSLIIGPASILVTMCTFDIKDWSLKP